MNLTATRSSMERYLESRRAPATRQAYASDRRDFQQWCTDANLSPTDQETVALYIAHLADSGRKPSTIRRRLAALNSPSHGASRSALTRQVAEGVRRELGTAQRRVAPVTPDILDRMLESVPDGLHGIRDRAILALGMHAALRRSEIAALKLEDLQFTDRGIILTIRRSKTDQEGAGRQIGIAHRCPGTCPACLLKTWLDMAQISEGIIFRRIRGEASIQGPLSGRAIAEIVKAAAKAAGLDEALYSGHSLRAGHVTWAVMSGVSETAVMQVTGHRDVATMGRYVRPGLVWGGNHGNLG